MNVREVEKFLAAHPHYDVLHVQQIEAFARRLGIPFCDTCCDWHGPDDAHSAP